MVTSVTGSAVRNCTYEIAEICTALCHIQHNPFQKANPEPF